MKTKIRVATTEAEIDAAIEQAKIYDAYRPKAVAVKYRRNDDVVAITLATGVELLIPRKLLQGLESATPLEIADVQIVDAQSALRWPKLDVDHYLPGLVEGIFGNRRWMSEIGKKGGAKCSVAKARAARANGRRGGRPKRERAT